MLDHVSTLANGVVIKACTMPDTHCVTLLLALKGGAAWEPLAQNGVTHLVEHLCFRRAGGVPQEPLYFDIERTGGHLRGVTYRDSVLFELTVHPKHFHAAAAILRRLFDDNGWTHEDIRREKQVVCRQIEDSHAYLLPTMLSDFFDRAPSGEPVIGRSGKVNRLSRAAIEQWKDQLFNTHCATLIPTGDFSRDDLRHAEELFGTIGRARATALADIRPATFLLRSGAQNGLYTAEEDRVTLGLTFDVDKARAALRRGSRAVRRAKKAS